MDIKKVIIPVGGLGTRFLPLSKVVSKEFWPLVDEPVIHRILTEAKDSGIKEIIFVLSPGNKKILDYYSPHPKIEKTLKERKKTKLLDEFKKSEDFLKGISINYVIQKKPLGDGHAILQAAKLIGEEPVACLLADDIVDSEIPCLLQLIKVFKTCQKSVVSLHQLPEKKLFAYGIVDVEKIANRFFKIKNANLCRLAIQVKKLEREIKKKIFYHHIPREKNKEADKLLNHALDNYLAH